MTSSSRTGVQLEAATSDVDEGAIRAFKALANETRLAILLTLWDHYDPDPGFEPISFKELFERVDFADTGNFSYHLEKLTGHFVAAAEDGYHINSAGLHLVGTVIEGTGMRDASFGPTVVEEPCPFCGAPIEIEYDAEILTARCTDCEGLWQDAYERGTLLSFWLPPVGARERSPAEAFRTTFTLNMQKARSYQEGVCLFCSGRVERTVDVCTDHEPGEGACSNCGRYHLVEFTTVCPTCKGGVWGPARGTVLRHPAVTAFYYDHGVEHRSVEWESYGRMLDVEEELVSEDPLRVRFTVPADGEALAVTVDGDLAPVSVERLPATDA